MQDYGNCLKPDKSVWHGEYNAVGGDESKGRKVEFASAFAALKDKGANCVRLWVFGDGKFAPQWTGKLDDGVKGLDDQFLADFMDMLQKAKDKGLRVIPVLWDFLVFGKEPEDDAGREFYPPGYHYRYNMLLDPDCTRMFLDYALKPLLQEVKDKGLADTVYAWDVINEPEWAFPGEEPKMRHTCTPEQMRLFVAKCAACIHSFGGRVTVGSACAKFNYDDVAGRPGGYTNHWSDAHLQGVLADSSAHLDVYQVHYYNWMSQNLEWNQDPFAHKAADFIATDPATGALQKPLLLGEIQANNLPTVNGTQYNTTDMMKHAASHGYQGLLFWSYEGNIWTKDGKGAWGDFKDAIKAKP